MRRLFYFLIPALALGGVITWRIIQNKHQEAAQAQAAKARKTAPPNVRVATAVVRDIVHEYQGVGNVESPAEVRIAAKITGRVDYLQVREGDPVTRGEVLVRIDPSQIQASVVQQQAVIASAQASLTNAQIKYNRTYSVYKQGFTAAQDVDDARTEVNVQRSSVNAAVAQLHNLQSQYSDTVLRSPIDGFVTARVLDPGSVVTAGAPIVTVQALRNVYVTTSVPEEISGKIHVGVAATANIAAQPGRAFQGTVTQVNTAADPQSRQFLVRARFDNSSDIIKPGMYCSVTIVTQVTHNAVVVPREAVTNNEKGSIVTVVDANLVAHQRAVHTGDQDAVGIAITDGVKAGEQVITLSAQPVKDGQKVKIDTGNGQTGNPQAGTGQTGMTGQPAVVGGGGGAPLNSGAQAGGGANVPTYSLPQGGGSGQPSGGTTGTPGSNASPGGMGSSNTGTGGGASPNGPTISPTGPTGGGGAAPGSPALPGSGASPSTAPGTGVGTGTGGTLGSPSGGTVGAPGGGVAPATGTTGTSGARGR